MIETHIQNFINQYKLSNKTIIVGFSGGFDSMCLLYALNTIKNNYGLTLIGAHYNHNWRGEIAKKEQKHCEAFCKKLGITFYTETAPDDTKKNETVAREQRYEFFERAKLKYNTEIVFTAHNYNDNAETLIYRIAKGTGLTGLKGILEKRENYYRPLLDISRKQIEQYCAEHNLKPNKDDSNNDTVHKRNLIRHEILPILEEINPNVISAINTLSQVTQSELSILYDYISSVKNDVIKDGTILTKKFKNLSQNLQQKIIYDFIYNSEIDYDYQLISNATNFLIDAINKNKISKFSLTKNKWLYVDENIIEIIQKNDKTTEVIEIKSVGNYELCNKIFEISECCEPLKKTGDETCVNVDLTKFENLVLRTRRDGDIFQPLGTSGTMKLKKYLMSKKVPQYKRDDLILLCNEHEVLWVAGIGLSDKIKTITNSTHKLQIREK